MKKRRKRAAELEALVMERARERPDCAAVIGVTVVGDNGGWRVAAISRNNDVVAVKQINEIVAELRTKYDLAA